MDLLKKLLAAALLAPCILSAQNNFTNTQLLGQLNTITTAVPFLRIAPDARSGGMGETGVATSPDVNSIHWNVAKLAFAEKKTAFGISYVPWLRAVIPDINLAYVSFYTKPDSISAFTGSMRYFSMGNITTSTTVGVIGQFRPFEFAVDLGYSRVIAKYWSVGMAARYIHSNLTNGISIGNQSTRAGKAFAVDLGVYYMDRDRVRILDHPCTMTLGAAVTNIGSKIRYTVSAEPEFIPINLRVGQGFGVMLNPFNRLSLQYELNKLLVPSPPVYVLGPNGSPMLNSSGQPIIAAGRDPNVSVPKGMLQSFYDAPGGAREEFAEITFSTGLEYTYNNTFVVRTGYFYEAKSKGNRQYVTLGAGIRYQIFGLDFAYLIPANDQRSPLQNTLRFTLLIEFGNPRKSPPFRKHNVGF
jgi:hypothetical protein